MGTQVAEDRRTVASVLHLLLPVTVVHMAILLRPAQMIGNAAAASSVPATVTPAAFRSPS
jgi:hypothetical protein